MFKFKVETQHKHWCEDAEPYWMERIDLALDGCEDCPRLLIERILDGLAPLLRGEIIRVSLKEGGQLIASFEGLLTDESGAAFKRDCRGVFA